MANGNRVIVESPFSGNSKGKTKKEKACIRRKNIRYARACIKDCLNRGEYPFASHLLYTQNGVLNDDILEERRLGIKGNLEWMKLADFTAVYTDLGISNGMLIGIKEAKKEGKRIEYRHLNGHYRIRD